MAAPTTMAARRDDGCSERRWLLGETMVAPTDDGCLDEDTRGLNDNRSEGNRSVAAQSSNALSYSRRQMFVFGLLYGEAIEAYASIKHVLFSFKSDHKWWLNITEHRYLIEAISRGFCIISSSTSWLFWVDLAAV
ncbi:hypothetical protein QVD17_19512 [Tagetes erecta]|uniref:Uncharacterized protein n=1 Tax=Tagetes erecta TaxID=13708 RepID=A0AAD8KMS9_TARER|nr:hypothetical protein QVD17_19512 [Tagetes erecta]